jgi:hypothetical protein
VSASVRGGMDLSWTRASPSVDLTNASTTFLADDPASWPERILISGFTYDRFEPSRRADPAGGLQPVPDQRNGPEPAGGPAGIS